MTEASVFPQPTLPLPHPDEPPAQPFAPPLSSFIGRDQELDQIAQLLSQPDVRLITLTGPGGVGKTRLALEAGRRGLASRFPQVWMVTIAAWSGPEDVITGIAHAAGVREYGDRPLPTVLATALRDRRGLIILDNAEHVLGAASDVVALLAACPGLTMLVTSREPLRVTGEHELRLAPLATPDLDAAPAPFVSLATEPAAVRLFVSRAMAAQRSFTLDETNYQAVRAVCAALDGLPLAIELAAARIALLSPASLRDRLQQRENGALPVLTDGPRDLPDRQRTLRDTIRWSYELLTAPEQAAFRALSAFECVFSLDHAEALIETALTGQADPPSPFNLLAALVNKSLVVAYPNADPARFNLLATVRDFGREQLDRSADATQLRHVQAELVREQTAAWDAALEGPDYGDALAQFAAFLGNVTTALEHAARAREDELLLTLVGNAARLWRLRGLHGDGMQWLTLALARVPPGASVARIRALMGAGMLGTMSCDYRGGVEFYEQALALAEATGETHLAARCLFHLAEAHDAFGETDLAETLIEQAAAVATGDDPSLAVVIAKARGEFARRRGELEAARTTLGAGLARSRELGARWVEADLLMVLAAVARDEGDALRARDDLLAALAIYEDVDDPVGLAGVGVALAWLAPALGAAGPGLRLYAASNRLYELHGLREPRHKYASHEVWLRDVRAELGSAAAEHWRAGRAIERPALGGEIRTLAACFDHPRPFAAAPPDGLTEREIEVLRLLATGLSNGAIAERLYLSPRTINAHLTRIYDKLNVANRHAAIRYAIDRGLAPATAS